MHDYYAVLEIPVTANSETIRASYKRLALLRHPDKDLGNSKASTNFQLLQAAYETLSDPAKKRTYDLSRPSSFGSGRTSTQTNRTSTNPNPKTDVERARHRISVALQTLSKLEAERAPKDLDAFELDRKIRQLESNLRRSREADLEDDKKDSELSSFWTFLNLWGAREAPEDTESRRRARLDRVASRRVWETILQASRDRRVSKGEEISAIEAKIRIQQGMLQEAQRDEWLAKTNVEAEERARKRRESEATRKAAAEREREAREAREAHEKERRAWEVEREKRERKAAAERERKAREAREAHEKERRAREVEREERERKARDAAEKQQQKTRKRRGPAKAATNTEARGSGRRRQHGWSSCDHHFFWSREEGPHICSECDVQQRRFIFQCPGCNIIACAACRDELKHADLTRDRW